MKNAKNCHQSVIIVVFLVVYNVQDGDMVVTFSYPSRFVINIMYVRCVVSTLHGVCSARLSKMMACDQHGMSTVCCGLQAIL